MGAPPAWAAWDRQHVWHPYAPAPEPAYPIVGASGVHLLLADGRKLIDGMASWWCAIHGYRHPALVRAVQEQAGTLPHVMFGGLTHEPASRLAARLAALAPGDLNRVFFCDSGSVATEVALKMALQYWQAEKRPEKCRFLALRGGYHGDTFSAMSVSDPDNSLHERFRTHVPEQFFTPRPPAAHCDAEVLQQACQRFDADLKAHQDQIAGVILEPILQGAGGFHPYPAVFLAHVAQSCAQHDVLLIADEIATAFGRTGKLFACEHAEVTPDLMCVGKALTGGMLSLAATLVRDEIADTISRAGPFLHGPTFMGNPLACRAALASLDLLLEDDFGAQVAALEKLLEEQLMPLQNIPAVADVRILGAFAVVEMTAPVDVEAWQAWAVAHGVWLRPFHRYVYVMPPFVIQPAEITQLTDTIRAGVQELS